MTLGVYLAYIWDLPLTHYIGLGLLSVAAGLGAVRVLIYSIDYWLYPN